MFYFRANAVVKTGQPFLLKKEALHPFCQGMFFQTQKRSFATTLPQNLLNLTLGHTQPHRYFSSEAKTMQPPIGVSDFREIIEYSDSKGQPYLFVDKSLFIKDILEDSTKVKLFTRPRRFGKTLNMSMLHHFFAKEIDKQPTENLFKNLKIAKHDQFMKHQGQYPVIFLTFKDIQGLSFEEAYDDLRKLFAVAYEQHEQVILSESVLTSRQKDQYKRILDRNAPASDVKTALKDLTFYLHKSYGVKPIVLIDEYDTPIQTAYSKKYYEEMITFMREFLGAGLKDNSYLEQAILTGILRVSKESLFSGLNNVETYSLLNSQYGDYFGFTEEEVCQLLESSGLGNNLKEVRDWYNGYQCGNSIVYNPWSITHYIKKQGKLSSYWINTSGNFLIKDLLIQSSTDFKDQFRSLLQDNPVEMPINEHVDFTNLDTDESALWTLLLMSGYLNATVIKESGKDVLCKLRIPNKEVKDLYQTFIAEWLSGVNNAKVFNKFLNNLLEGNITDFGIQLQKMMLQTFSSHDIKGKNPEKFFHGFMLGLVACIDTEHYTIDSNKEGGLGRYDIVIVAKDPNKLGIIMEIKSVDDGTESTLKETAKEALKQIETKQYDYAPLLHHTKNCLKLGIAFSGKKLAMVHSKGPKIMNEVQHSPKQL